LSRAPRADRDLPGCHCSTAEFTQFFDYDDSLDVFGVHGVGGAIGTLLTGVFATAAVSIKAEVPSGHAGLIDGNPKQILIQLYVIAATLAWSALAAFVLLKLIDLFIPLRVSKKSAFEGLDLSQHGEALQ
jgi:Amt family ammonium transporter